MTRVMIAIEDDPGAPVSAEVELNDVGDPPYIMFRGQTYYPSRWRTREGRLVYKTSERLLEDDGREVLP